MGERSKTNGQWCVYEIAVLDFRRDYQGTTPHGYVGQSERCEPDRARTAGGHRVHGDVPFARFLEHLATKDFSDIMVGQPRVVAGPFTTEDAALAAETAEILARRPQYNIEGNPDHADRVPPFDQKRMRIERDQARTSGRDISTLGHSGYVTVNRGPTPKPNGHRVPGAPPTAAQERPPTASGRRRPEPRREAVVPPPPAAVAAEPRGLLPSSVLVRRILVGTLTATGAAAAAGLASRAGIQLPVILVVPLIAVFAALAAIALAPGP